MQNCGKQKKNNNLSLTNSFSENQVNFSFSHQKRHLLYSLIIFNTSNNTPSSRPIIERLLEFYHLWPMTQWVTSLVSLIILYGITGYYYNQWLSDKGGWLDFKVRVWLIISDLVINLALGLYYMEHRDTLMGAIMIKCPIAISPVIFFLELLCLYGYSRFFGRFPWASKNKDNQKN